MHPPRRRRRCPRRRPLAARTPWSVAAEGWAGARAQSRSDRYPIPRRCARAIEAIPNHQPSQPHVSGHDRGRLLRRAPPVRGRHAPGPARCTCRPAAGGASTSLKPTSSFDESGEPKTGPRSVPIPRPLVEMLAVVDRRRQVHQGATWLFRTRTGGPSDVVELVARRGVAHCETIDRPPMRIIRLPPRRGDDVADQAGVPLGEVARRIGHSVETLVSTYVGSARPATRRSRMRASMQSSRRRGSLPETPSAAENQENAFGVRPCPP